MLFVKKLAISINPTIIWIFFGFTPLLFSATEQISTISTLHDLSFEAAINYLANLIPPITTEKFSEELVSITSKYIGEKINELNQNGHTVFISLIHHYVICENEKKKYISQELINFYMDHESLDLNICDPNGNNALMVAIELNCMFAIKLILSKCEKIDNINHKNTHGDTALMLAVKQINMDIILELLKSRARPNINLHCTDAKNSNIVDILQEKIDDHSFFTQLTDLLNIQSMFIEYDVKPQKPYNVTLQKRNNCLKCTIL